MARVTEAGIGCKTGTGTGTGTGVGLVFVFVGCWVTSCSWPLAKSSWERLRVSVMIKSSSVWVAVKVAGGVVGANVLVVKVSVLVLTGAGTGIGVADGKVLVVLSGTFMFIHPAVGAGASVRAVVVVTGTVI